MWSLDYLYIYSKQYCELQNSLTAKVDSWLFAPVLESIKVGASHQSLFSLTSPL